MTTPTSFAEALRIPAITHDTIDDLFATEADLRRAAHLLLDQRDTARSLAALLEQEAADLTVVVGRVRAAVTGRSGGGVLVPVTEILEALDGAA